MIHSRFAQFGLAAGGSVPIVPIDSFDTDELFLLEHLHCSTTSDVTALDISYNIQLLNEQRSILFSFNRELTKTFVFPLAFTGIFQVQIVNLDETNATEVMVAWVGHVISKDEFTLTRLPNWLLP